MSGGTSCVPLSITTTIRCAILDRSRLNWAACAESVMTTRAPLSCR